MALKWLRISRSIQLVTKPASRRSGGRTFVPHTGKYHAVSQPACVMLEPLPEHKENLAPWLFPSALWFILLPTSWLLTLYRYSDRCLGTSLTLMKVKSISMTSFFGLLFLLCATFVLPFFILNESFLILNLMIVGKKKQNNKFHAISSINCSVRCR